MMEKHKIKEIEFYAEIKNETDLAYCFFDGCEEFWMPKSHTCIVERIKGVDVRAACPEWLAKKKGII